MANKHGDFIWYELMTPDPEAAKTFYDDVVDWKIGDRLPGDIDYRQIAAGEEAVGGVLRLSEEMCANGAVPAWVGYIGVADVDRAAESIEAAGGAILMQPFDVPDVGRIAMVTDPQGAPFYVMRGASDGSSVAFASDRPRPGHCAWNELSTTDPRAALAFYDEQFGWKKDGEMDMGPLGAYEFLRHGFIIGGMMKKPAEMPAPSWTYYFRVRDIDVAVERIEAGGGRVVRGPEEIPGGDWTINGIDPQGAAFALVGARS